MPHPHANPPTFRARLPPTAPNSLNQNLESLGFDSSKLFFPRGFNFRPKQKDLPKRFTRGSQLRRCFARLRARVLLEQLQEAAPLLLRGQPRSNTITTTSIITTSTNYVLRPLECGRGGRPASPRSQKSLVSSRLRRIPRRVETSGDVAMLLGPGGRSPRRRGSAGVRECRRPDCRSPPESWPNERAAWLPRANLPTEACVGPRIVEGGCGRSKGHRTPNKGFRVSGKQKQLELGLESGRVVLASIMPASARHIQAHMHDAYP